MIKLMEEYSIHLDRGKNYQFIQNYEVAPITGGPDLDDDLCKDALNSGYLSFQKMGNGEWWLVIPSGTSFVVHAWNIDPSTGDPLEICELPNGYQIVLALSNNEHEFDEKISDFVKEV